MRRTASALHRYGTVLQLTFTKEATMAIDKKSTDIEKNQTSAPPPPEAKNGETGDDEKKLFLRNKIIQAQSTSAVEAKARLMDDQGHVPDNGD